MDEWRDGNEESGRGYDGHNNADARMGTMSLGQLYNRRERWVVAPAARRKEGEQGIKQVDLHFIITPCRAEKSKTEVPE